MRMVFVFYLHKLDGTKYFKALSASIPCNLPTDLNTKIPLLCRPDQNDDLNTKDAVYLAKLSGWFCPVIRHEIGAFHNLCLFLLFLEAGTSLRPKRTCQKTSFQQLNDNFTSILK